MLSRRIVLVGMLLAPGACAPAEQPAVPPDTVAVEPPAVSDTVTATAWTGYRAGGNEPFWTLTVGASTMDFADMGVNSTATAPRPTPEEVAEGWRFTATANGQPFVAVIRQRGCNDSMSGRPFPHTVSVEVNGQTYTGCGGDSSALLSGAEWRVVELDGAPAASRAPTLSFNADGALTGSGGCNNYRGSFEITGEGIRIGPAMATRMACAEDALNQQESRFFTLLEQVTRFDVVDGRLVLYAQDRAAIVAER